MKNYKIGNVNSFESLGTLDGDGIRFIIFMQGCNKRCVYCHNPETQELMQSILINSYELLQKIIRYKPYFKERGGVTFSGGEPLMQAEFLLELCELLKEEKINITIDTSGYYLNEDVRKLLKICDTVLLDIKGLNDNETVNKCQGSFSEFSEIIKFLNTNSIRTIIRSVIIPNQNDNKEYIYELVNIIKKFDCVKEIELLGYNNLATEKYEKLNRIYKLKEIPSLKKEKLKELQIFCNSIFK